MTRRLAIAEVLVVLALSLGRSGAYSLVSFIADLTSGVPLAEQTTTLGVRSRPIQRVKVARRFETVTTRWGDVQVKLRGWRGRVIDAAPEYEDCLALARAAEVPIRDVWNEAHRMGEVFVGQRWSPDRTPSLRVVPPPAPEGAR